ncbi:hypothetical protein ABZ297_11580 [Nonomuraea sp. NPDC005983]|uniref:hypothetical protein n=1 Tax=Nonomuraea sp. NPDC005983 TaxID=3155595 RepID=UPI0033ACD879
MTDQRHSAESGPPIARRVMLSMLGAGAAALAAAPLVQGERLAYPSTDADRQSAPVPALA